jgi:hypothetical protein
MDESGSGRHPARSHHVAVDSRETYHLSCINVRSRAFRLMRFGRSMWLTEHINLRHYVTASSMAKYIRHHVASCHRLPKSRVLSSMMAQFDHSMDRLDLSGATSPNCTTVNSSVTLLLVVFQRASFHHLLGGCIGSTASIVVSFFVRVSKLLPSVARLRVMWPSNNVPVADDAASRWSVTIYT